MLIKIHNISQTTASLAYEHIAVTGYVLNKWVDGVLEIDTNDDYVVKRALEFWLNTVRTITRIEIIR